jgi:TonB family protein
LIRVDAPDQSTGDDLFPYPAPAIHPDALFVSPADLGKRLAGSMMVPPDPGDMTAIGMSGDRTITASFNYCIGTDGKVDWVQVLTQSEFPGYNAKLEKTVANWQFAPPPQPLCTTAMFSYTQR